MIHHATGSGKTKMPIGWAKLASRLRERGFDHRNILMIERVSKEELELLKEVVDVIDLGRC